MCHTAGQIQGSNTSCKLVINIKLAWELSLPNQTACDLAFPALRITTSKKQEEASGDRRELPCISFCVPDEL